MGRLQIVWHLIDTLVEAGILIVLLIEFNYDKIQDEKREYKETQKKRKKALVATPVSSSGSKKDLAVESRTSGDIVKSPEKQGDL